uniref:Choline transporter-like protein n=1 Tax=Neobodo designis TaxID=312471 RepID=A0A7S1MQC9_NEODS|mmetsp:Transcript_43889/g.135491  ORF Transcript_43889/g.135491 Transcript_43889/m.135491 type:complete len:520 (+) Transcript_43889:202-1761(+)
MYQQGNVNGSPKHGHYGAYDDHHDDHYATPGRHSQTHGYVGRDSQHEPLGVVAYDERTFAASGRKCEAVEVGVPIDEGSAAQRFNRSQWDGIIRLLALAVLIPCILAARNARDFHNGTLHVSDATRRELHAMREWLPLGFGLALLVAGFVFAAMRAFTEQFIIIANVLVIVINAAFAAWAFARGYVVMGVIWGLIAALNAVWLYFVRRRIPFAAVLLRTSVTLITRHYGTLVTSFACLLAGAVYLAVWVFMGAPVFTQISDAHDNGTSVPGWVAPAVLGMLIALLWASQVCANVAHVTTSGVVATWYFFGEAAMPPGPSAASAKRALTTSFGSICFGSAVVALLKTIYYFLRRAIDAIDQPIVECILGCILGVIERLTELFNIYAFTQVAIYGHDFVTAAKQTFALVKESGWSLIINDCLVWRSLAITNLVCSLGLCVVFWIAFNPIVGLLTLAVALSVFTIFFRPVYAGIATQFVCIAENPTAMEVANPEWAATTNALKPQDVGNQETGGDQRPVQRV